MTPDTLRDALAVAAAVAQDQAAVSDHAVSLTVFQGDHLVVEDRAGRQYVLSFRPWRRPEDPPVSTDHCPWVIDHDPVEGEVRCGTELRVTAGPRSTTEAVCASGHRFVRCACGSQACTGWRAQVAPGPHMPGIVP